MGGLRLGMMVYLVIFLWEICVVGCVKVVIDDWGFRWWDLYCINFRLGFMDWCCDRVKLNVYNVIVIVC